MTPVTYQYYTEEYHGSQISENDFPKLERKARRYLSGFTFGKIDSMQDVGTDIKDCICDLAENIQNETSKVTGNGIASESGDGHSVTFEKSKTEAELIAQYYDIARMYLINTGLLYGGVDICSTARNW
jgi:hypothetical protein